MLGGTVSAGTGDYFSMFFYCFMISIPLSQLNSLYQVHDS